MKISIIGCGASGMTAAISAIRNGADPSDITIFEASDRPGRKILATGNGRCNLGNEYLEASCFYTYGKQGKDLLGRLLSEFDTDDLKAFFRSLDIITVSKNGYLYPRSMQASSVLNALMTEINDAGVGIVYSALINSICKKDGRFVLKTADSCYEADRVIVSSGFGSGGFDVKAEGMDIKRDLSMMSDSFEYRTPVPALCGLVVSEDITSIAGVRTKGGISLFSYEELLGCDEGELQFTKECISGIPVFQVSRQAAHALKAGQPVSAELDLIPEMTEDELRTEIYDRIKAHPSRKIYEILNGLINDKLIKYIYLGAGISGRDKVLDLPSEKIDMLILLFKHLLFEITGTEKQDKAQTMSGGVSISSVNDDLSLKGSDGLYITGELLDIDGKCGGYNLYLAWATGLIAGRSAAK